LLIKYIKSVLWRVAKCLSYIEEALCLKVNRRVPVCTDLGGGHFEHFFCYLWRHKR